MSSVYEVESVSVDDVTFNVVAGAIDNITITATDPIDSISIVTEVSPEIVTVEVPGPQGAPGLQGIYAQPNDPSVEFGWGAAEEGLIWIPTTI